MIRENNYDFLKRMREVHHPDRRDRNAVISPNEIEFDNSWAIVIPTGAGALIRRAATDFQDYLLTSMAVSVPIRIDGMDDIPARALRIAVVGADSGDSAPAKTDAFTLDVSTARGIELRGFDERALFRGTIHLEDLMNLRGAPFVELGITRHIPLARMRSVHSGCGIDDFPDWQLNAIAHAGFTAIDVFVKAPDVTAKGPCNINDLIERAAGFGLDTVLYSYLRSYKHPDDPDADVFFDAVYGEIFRRHPGAAAIHLVGESLSFPSRDEHTSGKPPAENVVDGIPDPRPSPGWYTCRDYPKYIRKVAEAVHRVKPDAEVIVNTYNWGYLPAEQRRAFLEKLPRDLTIHVTYDIFKKNRRGDLSCPTMDYTVSAADPGEYFVSETNSAAELGFSHVRVTGNTAGASWDFGTVPYVPVPFRWAHRMEVLKQYLRDRRIDSLYETHHYGWWPNPCNDLAKAIFRDGSETDVGQLLSQVAARDYGKAAAPGVVETWRIWSDAMDHYVATNEDQYGPWRVGPAYPFIFQPNLSRCMFGKEIKFPTAPHAHFGYKIIKTFYSPYENDGQSPAPLRYPVEIAELEKMLGMWERGLEKLASLTDDIPENRRRNYERLCALGKFIRNSIVTTLHIKRWWILNMRLQNASDRPAMLALLDRIEELAQEEIANVRDTFEAVRTDSRIGWEPSMEYVCDEWHLDWKLRQMESMLRETSAYRAMIEL